VEHRRDSGTQGGLTWVPPYLCESQEVDHGRKGKKPF
jgi:hypothetical protein